MAAGQGVQKASRIASAANNHGDGAGLSGLLVPVYLVREDDSQPAGRHQGLAPAHSHPHLPRPHIEQLQLPVKVGGEVKARLAGQHKVVAPLLEIGCLGHGLPLDAYSPSTSRR